jgi:hypothetical protein
MKKSDFKKKIAEQIQAGLRGFISTAISRAEALPDGSIKVSKEQVDRWKKVLNTTYHRASVNEKYWASSTADRVLHVMELFKKNATKTKADPRVQELKDSFVEYCENIKGFKPVINHAKDTVMIKRILVNYTKEEILDCFDWFLNDKISDDLSPSISTALASSVFNRFLRQR